MGNFTNLLTHSRHQADGADQARGGIVLAGLGAHLVFVDQGLNGVHVAVAVSHVDARHDLVAQATVIVVSRAVRMHDFGGHAVELAQILGGFKGLATKIHVDIPCGFGTCLCLGGCGLDGGLTRRVTRRQACPHAGDFGAQAVSRAYRSPTRRQ